MSLRPPSTSPSPSPAPSGNMNGSAKSNARASMGPSGRPAPINLVNPPASPRAGGGRPTSELLGGAGMFQTPEGSSRRPIVPFCPSAKLTCSYPSFNPMFFCALVFILTAEAIDQWFENLQNYEATLVRFLISSASSEIGAYPLCRKRWLLPLSM